jgi:hypothetical protein
MSKPELTVWMFGRRKSGGKKQTSNNYEIDNDEYLL